MKDHSVRVRTLATKFARSSATSGWPHELEERIIAGIEDVNRHPAIHTWSYKPEPHIVWSGREIRRETLSRDAHCRCGPVALESFSPPCVRALDQSGAAVAVKNCTGREFIANKEKDGMPDIARCTDAADRNASS